MKEFLRSKKNLWLLAWLPGAAMYVTARFVPNAAEYVFARGIYRVYSNAMAFLTGLIPISLAELLVIAVPVFFAALIPVAIVRMIVRKTGIEGLKVLRLMIVLLGIIFSWYMLGCGTNYYRYEFSAFSGLTVQRSTVDELEGLCTELAGKAATARERAAAEAVKSGSMAAEDEVYNSYLSQKELKEASRSAMYALADKYPIMKGYFPRPKAVFFSRVMSEFNFTGVYFPWTVEANVNVDIPDYPQAVTMCHELSHLRGFMREDEANFIGYLACAVSGEPDLEYSGYMLALTYSANQLYAESPERWGHVRALYSDGMVADMVANSEYWKQFEDTVAAEIGENMNNAYLKANKQTDGTKSYGRMVDLLLAEWRANREDNGGN